MAKKTTPKRVTRKSPRKTATDAALEVEPIEPAEADSGLETAETTEAIEPSPAKSDEAPARGTRRGGARARKSVATRAPQAQSAAAPTQQPAPQIEQEGGAVVIRFPRSGPPNPFAPSTRPVIPPPPPTPAARAPDARPQPGDRARPDDRRPLPTAEPRSERAAPRRDERASPPTRHEHIAPRQERSGPPGTGADGGAAPNGDESAEGGARRRRRRRGGRGGRGRGTGTGTGGGSAAPHQNLGPVRPADYLLAPDEPDEDAGGADPGAARPPEAPARADSAPGEGGAPRRRRRRGGRGRRRGETGAAADGPPGLARTPAIAPIPLSAGDVGDADPEAEFEFTADAREAMEPAPEAPAAAPRARGRERGGSSRRRRPRHDERSEVADVREADDGGEEMFIIGDAVPEADPAAVRADSDEADVVDFDLAVDVGDGPTATGVRKDMIINVMPHEECRIGLLENNKLQEIYLERASAENHVGNIYKGVVTNVEASIQAAFLDFGLGKNGFLHVSDLHPQYFPHGDGNTESVGRKLARRHRPPIQRCLRRGQELLVQILKEGIGTKGPTLTTYLSVPGRFLVLMPGMRQMGVSRKIENDEQRHALRTLLNQLELPPDMGFIARTAAVNRTKRELQSDLNYLSRLWRAVEKRIENDRAPAELYRESDLVIRTIRDVFTTDVERIIVDDPGVAERAREFLGIFSPRAGDIVQNYEGTAPIFHHYGIEAELERLHSRHVPLRIGGSLVIDQTEALVAIDVNSGRFRSEDDSETTAFKINCEAADEIPRQLRLRDLGGVIICDFIDMRLESHRREIEKRLVKNLKQHKERAKVLRMSQFGIVEMTRQRQRASLTRSVYQDCHHCRGRGLIKTPESVALDAMRIIQLAVTREHIRNIELSVSTEVAYLLQNRKRTALYELEQRHGRAVSIKPEASYGLDQLQIHCFDQRGRVVPYT